MRVAEIVSDMREILAGNLQAIRIVHIAKGQHDLPAEIAAWSGPWICGQHEATFNRFQAADWLIALDLQIELFDDTTKIGQILFAGDALLMIIRDRYTGNRQTLG